ncbi:molybdenum cofactor guanylyltransferase [bacterium]|nr:molybdenum cofactor guanylyltransferase [bacterium]
MIGWLLVGGAGTRMGGLKASRLFRGRPLWIYGYELLGGFCDEVRLLGHCPEIELPALVEPEPGQGPLGAICAGLRASPSPWNFVLALDYPLLDSEFVAQLGAPQRGLARLPRCGPQQHPLCGYYHRGLSLPTQGSVLKALASQPVEWVDFGADPRFHNVNEFSDLAH